MAGRKAGFRHNEDTRKKIQASAIITRLMTHITADTPIMDASQVNAAKALLNKVLPDLSSVSMDASVSGDVTMTFKTVYENKPDGN